MRDQATRSRRGSPEGGAQDEMNYFNMELAEAEGEVRQLEDRLRIVPVGDLQLRRGLQGALEQKRERLAMLRSRQGKA